MDSLSPQQWLQLKKPTRDALVKIFKIPQSTFTHVVNNQVESDGHTFNDLKAISVEEMKQLTHNPSDSFEEQFNMIIKMVESDGNVASVQPENVTPNATPTTETGTNPGTEEGSKPQAPVNQEQVLPVPGGEQQVDSGRAELLPNPVSDNPASVATEDAKVDTEKSEAGQTSGSGTRGRKKN